MKPTNSVIPAVLALVLGLALGARVTLPHFQSGTETRRVAQERVTTLAAEVAHLGEEQARERQVSRERDDLQASLPDDETLPAVLSTLQDAARRLGVRSGRLTRNVRASEVPGVLAVDLTLEMRGTYPRMQALIQTLAALPRAYTSQGVTLTTDGSGLSGTLKVTTYARDRTPPSPAPGTAPGGVTPTAAGGIP